MAGWGHFDDKQPMFLIRKWSQNTAFYIGSILTFWFYISEGVYPLELLLYRFLEHRWELFCLLQTTSWWNVLWDKLSGKFQAMWCFFFFFSFYWNKTVVLLQLHICGSNSQRTDVRAVWVLKVAVCIEKYCSFKKKMITFPLKLHFVLDLIIWGAQQAQVVAMIGQLSNMTPERKRVHMSEIWLKEPVLTCSQLGCRRLLSKLNSSKSGKLSSILF